MVGIAGSGSPVLGLAIGLVGLGVVGWAVARGAPFYNTGYSIGVFVISSLPFIAYVLLVRRPMLIFLTGVALLASTLVMYGSYGLTPASSRDGVEGISILVGLGLNVVVVFVGALSEHRKAQTQ
jgi:hypothetical protein